MDYQKIILIGNVAVGPEVRQSKKGDVDFTIFSLGVSIDGENTLFFPVTAFGKLGEAIAIHVNKGHQVLVEGKINIGETIHFNPRVSKSVGKFIHPVYWVHYEHNFHPSFAPQTARRMS